jgi:3-hydroxypropanoate dehydrogenase
VKLAPTSANCSPARFRFVKSREAEAKEKLKPHLSEGNRDKTMNAPVCTIVGYDLDFYKHLPKLFPHADAKSWFEGNEAKIFDTAFRNGTLQGASRALGLDCGPMSGFDSAGVDRDFFAGTNIKSNFLCSLGHGTRACCSRDRHASASTRWHASFKKPPMNILALRSLR